MKNNKKITPPSSTSSSSPTSSSKDINLNPPAAAKIADGTYRDKIRWIIETVEKIHDCKCSGGQAGKMLKWAGNIGDVIVAINKTGDWIKDKDFMPAVRKELRGRRLWSDLNLADSKAYNNRFEKMLDQKFGKYKLADVLIKMLKGQSPA